MRIIVTFLLVICGVGIAWIGAAPPVVPPTPSDRPETPPTPPAGETIEIGTAVYVGDDMVRGYSPDPALVVPETLVEIAKFPAIDMHCHWTIDVEPAALLAAMEERNIVAAVNLSGGEGAQLDDMLARFTHTAPERLITFCNLNFARCGEADFDAYVLEVLRTAKGQGVRGLKIFKDLGLRIRDVNDELLAVDDERLDIVWRTCGELGLPVLIHTADPVAFFQPINESNERWMQLYRHPDWSFYGEDFPPRDEVLAQRRRMMERHPNTIFICAHLGGYGEDLRTAAAVLDAHPNMSMDIAGRVAELGRQPYSARRFLLKYHDRILFGTDRYPGRSDQPRYRTYFRFLETDDEYFQYYDHPFPPTGEWRIYGVFLPDDVLRDLYHDNAARLLGLPTLEATDALSAPPAPPTSQDRTP
jgi:predicted TIM-barrel fold metal-dependent hydrolase